MVVTVLVPSGQGLATSCDPLFAACCTGSKGSHSRYEINTEADNVLAGDDRPADEASQGAKERRREQVRKAQRLAAPLIRAHDRLIRPIVHIETEKLPMSKR